MKLPIITVLLINSFLYSSLSHGHDHEDHTKIDSHRNQSHEHEADTQEPLKQLDYDDPLVRASYTVGVGAGIDLRDSFSLLEGTPITISYQAVLDGFIDGFQEKPGIDQETFDMVMEDFKQRVESALADKQAKEEAAEQQEITDRINFGAEFLEKNKSEKDVVSLPSGLQYKILKKGNGASPKAEDRVAIHYVGTLQDGTEFESTYKRGSPTNIDLKNAIKAWGESLPMMKEGGKWRIFVPPQLGYGDIEYTKIPIMSVLVFDIELLKVEKTSES